MAKKLISKLDGRNLGFGYFEYSAVVPILFPVYNNKQVFYKWRNWCWENWGASKEVHHWLEDIRETSGLRMPAESHNNHWAWQNDDYNCRIFLKTDSEAGLFLLKWG